MVMLDIRLTPRTSLGVKGGASKLTVKTLVHILVSSWGGASDVPVVAGLHLRRSPEFYAMPRTMGIQSLELNVTSL